MRNIKDFIKNFYKIILSGSLFFIIIILIHVYSLLESNSTLRIKYLDIGQGDATLIISPRGQKTLIDTGPNFIINQKIEDSLSVISPKLDNLLLTHPDLDHVGGTEALISEDFLKKLVISTENTYLKYGLDSIKVNNTKNLDIGGVYLEIISPKINQFGDTNHNSIVSQIKYGNIKFIFMADADTEIERNLVSQGYFKKDDYITVLKIGHHGSDTSSSEFFLKTIKPEYCIVSVGKNNKYDHPKPIVIERLSKYCGETYRTDQDGGVEFVTDGKKISIFKDK